MVREYIYTGPGGAPSFYEPNDPINTREQQANLGAAAIGLGAGAVTSPAMFLDMPGYAARFLSKVPAWVDEYIDPFDVGAEARAAGDGKLLGQDMAAAVEKFAPRDYFTKKAQDLVLGGKREHFVEKVGEFPFTAGGLVGGVGGLFGLAKAAPKWFKGLDTFTDVMTGVPSQKMMQGATTLPQIIGAGAGIGLASSVVPAGDVGFNPETGEFDLPAAGTMLAAGPILGAGIPAVIGGASAIPQLGKGMKGALDNMVQGVSQMVKQSDNVKLFKEVKQAEMERAQMAEFSKQAEIDTAKAYQPEPAPAPKVEKTFAEKVPSYEEQPNVTKMQEEDLTRLAQEEAKHTEEFQAKSSKLEEELDTVSSYIEETKTKPIEVTDQEVSQSYKGPKTKKETIDNLRAAKKAEIEAEQTKLKAAAKEELDTAMSQQMKLKEKEKNLAKLIKEKTPEELQKEFGKPIEKVRKQLEKDILNSEKGIGKIQKKLDAIDKKLEKTVPVKRQEVEAEIERINQEKEAVKQDLLKQKEAEQQKLIQELETEADNLFNRYEKEQQAYQGKLDKVQQQRQEVEGFAPKPQLPAVIEKAPEVSQPKPRFISGKQGIKEYDPQTGLPVPMKKVEVTPEGDVIVPPETTPKIDIEKLRSGDISITAKVNRVRRVLRTKFLRASKKLGNALIGHNQNERLKYADLLDHYKVPGETIRKYINNDEAMAQLANARIGKVSKDQVPKDLMDAVEALQEQFQKDSNMLNKHGYTIGSKNDAFYFPFRVHDFKGLSKVIRGDAEITLKRFLREEGIEDLSKKIELKPEEMDLINRKLEQARVVKEYTPEMMKFYKPMPEAFKDYAKNISQAYADALLFGDDISKPLIENFATVLQKADDIDPKKYPEVIDDLFTYFNARQYIPHPTLRIYQSLLSQFLYTGHKTTIAQFGAILANLRKSGLLETINSGVHIAQTLFRKKPAFYSRLNRHGTMQDLNEGLNKSWAEIRDYLWSNKYSLGEKSLATAEKGSYAVLNFADWLEKEGTYAANFEWLKNNVNKKSFNLFMDRYGELFTPKEMGRLKRELRLMKKGRMKIPSDLVYKAVDARAGEQLVVGNLDKTAFALSGVPGRIANTAMTFPLKFADEVDYNTRVLLMEGIKEKNWQKVNAAITMAGAFALSLPFASGFNEFKNEFKISDPLSPKPLIRGVDKALEPLGSVAEGIKEYMPMLARSLDLYASLSRPEADNVSATMNFAAPGSYTVFKTSADTLGTLARLKNPWDVEENPSAKRLPPQMLMTALYEKSDRGKQAESFKQEKKSGVLATKRKATLVQDMARYGELAKDKVQRLDDPEMKKEFNKVKTKVNRYKKYGTFDPLEASNRKILMEAYPQYERAFIDQLDQYRQTGRIDESKYQEVLNSRKERILKVLQKRMSRGKL